jgi:hypothetical protein
LKVSVPEDVDRPSVALKVPVSEPVGLVQPSYAGIGLVTPVQDPGSHTTVCATKAFPVHVTVTGSPSGSERAGDSGTLVSTQWYACLMHPLGTPGSDSHIQHSPLPVIPPPMQYVLPVTVELMAETGRLWMVTLEDEAAPAATHGSFGRTLDRKSTRLNSSHIR